MTPRKRDRFSRPPWTLGFFSIVEVGLLLAAFFLVLLSLGAEDRTLQYIALTLLALIVLVHLARLNLRREWELHKSRALVSFPLAPRVPEVPKVPEYRRQSERQAPQPQTVTFPRNAPYGKPGPPVSVTTKGRCPRCGSEVRPGSKFCYRCGSSLAA